MPLTARCVRGEVCPDELGGLYCLTYGVDELLSKRRKDEACDEAAGGGAQDASVGNFGKRCS